MERIGKDGAEERTIASDLRLNTPAKVVVGRRQAGAIFLRSAAGSGTKLRAPQQVGAVRALVKEGRKIKQTNPPDWTGTGTDLS